MFWSAMPATTALAAVTTACPARADRVVCRGCGLNEPAGSVSGARATHLRDVERGADQRGLAHVRIAKKDARNRGELPGWAS
jgi:hypothetical protein